jgi:hypothetical protein
MIVTYQYTKLHMLNSNGSLTAIKLETTQKIHVIAMSVKKTKKINYYDKVGIVFLRCSAHKFRPIHLIMLMFLLLYTSE